MIVFMFGAVLSTVSVPVQTADRRRAPELEILSGLARHRPVAAGATEGRLGVHHSRNRLSVVD